jgi:hypothetical protein
MNNQIYCFFKKEVARVSSTKVGQIIFFITNLLLIPRLINMKKTQIIVWTKQIMPVHACRQNLIDIILIKGS